MNLRGKRVLVTGGAGFVGSHIVDLLLGEECRSITAVDNFVRGRPENLPAALARSDFHLVEGDIRNEALLRRLVREADVVFHQAALRITHCVAEPRLAMEVMVGATYNLLEACVESGVEKLIAASSASIYGQADRFPIGEDCNPYSNRTLYGAAKAFNEALYRSFADMHGLRYVALRYFNVYGPRMDVHGKYTEVMIRWMERIEDGLPPLVFGDGRQTMDFVHVRDVARANLLAAKSDATDEAFNVASGVETSLAELAGLLAHAMQRPQLRPEFRGERAVNPVARRLGDPEKARALLGFSTTIPLEDGLRDLVTWWRGQRVAGTAPAPAHRAAP
jgi:nucleoside-diphosphate-sugar epimerase